MSLIPKENDVYEVTYKNIPYRAEAKSINEVATKVIKTIGRNVEKALAKCNYSFPDYIPISITGGGIAFIRGAKDLLCDTLAKSVEIVAPQMPLAEKVNLSTAWGLMDYAIERAENESASIFDKLY